jgi:hypothetical protein
MQEFLKPPPGDWRGFFLWGDVGERDLRGKAGELLPTRFDPYLGSAQAFHRCRHPREGPMQHEEPHARIAYRGSAISRAKLLGVKALVLGGGALVLASAFVLSVVFVAIGLVVVLTVGGYLWWKTRELRRQMRAQMQRQSQPWADGDVIEGEVISRERTLR